MSKKTVARIACLSTLLGLSACGGGVDDSGICRVIAGGNSTADATVNAGTLNGSERAFDGSLSTLATYTATVGNGRATFTGRGQPGTIVGSGSFAGVALKLPPNTTTLNVSISTTLDGTVQESGSAGTFSRGEPSVCGGTCAMQGDSIFFGIPTTRSFNGITAELQVAGSPVELSIRELCVR